MNSLIALLGLVSCLIVTVNSQPRNDVAFKHITYLAEQMNPVLNRHRGRYRPFAGQKGSPIANIRAGRSIEEAVHISPTVECVYAFESLFCAGTNKDGVESKVECDAQENFNNIGHENIKSYALSDIRILKTGEQTTMTKMYMFGQEESTTWMSYIVRDLTTKNRNVLSVHSAADKLTDQGITVLDDACWENMITFFKSIKNVEQVDLLKNQKPIKIIASLSVL